MWELHPHGDAVVRLPTGRITLVLERSGDAGETELRERGDLVLVPRGVWHTAKVAGPSSVLVITPGEGTRNRKV